MRISPWRLQVNSPVLCEDGRVLCAVGVTYREVETADIISLHRTYGTPLPERPIGGLVAAPIVRTASHLSSQTGAIMGRRKEKAAGRTQCARAATSAIASAGMALRQQSGAVSARALLGLGVVE